jgi:hypothetical protein
MGFDFGRTFKTRWSRLDGPIPHAIIATAAVLGGVFGLGFVPWVMGAANTAWWTLWEVVTGVIHGKGPFPWSGKWGWRKRMEMLFPIAIGWAVTGGLYAWMVFG